MYGDNQPTIALIVNLEHHFCTKHIDILYHYVRKQIQNGIVAIKYISTKSMFVDGLTKPLIGLKFLLHSSHYWTSCLSQNQLPCLLRIDRSRICKQGGVLMMWKCSKLPVKDGHLFVGIQTTQNDKTSLLCVWRPTLLGVVSFLLGTTFLVFFACCSVLIPLLLSCSVRTMSLYF